MKNLSNDLNVRYRLELFDFFRAIAITFVLLGHYFDKNTFLSNSADAGVDIFFVLSGYLVSKSFKFSI